MRKSKKNNYSNLKLIIINLNCAVQRYALLRTLNFDGAVRVTSGTRIAYADSVKLVLTMNYYYTELRITKESHDRYMHTCMLDTRVTYLVFFGCSSVDE